MSFVYEPPYSSLEDFWRQYWINFQSNVLSWICSENYYFQTMSHKIKSARLECSKLMIGTDENDHPIRSLQSLLILKENILNVKCKKIKIGAIDFQELKEALAFAYRYDFIPYPFLTIAHQLFETFLEDEFVECSAVCLVLMDVKIQQLCQGPNFNYMIQPLTQLHTSYMEYFQVLWNLQTPNSDDSKAKMLEILQYLQLPHPFQSSIIKTVQEAAITYAFVSDQLLSTMQFVENNKEAIEENESEPKISTQNLNFLIKFTNAVVSLKYADFQSVPETAYELYKICLTILQTLKTENVCLAVKIYSKVVAQITVCLSTMNVFFKNTQSTLLEEYCKVFLNHYEELEKYIEKNKAEIHEDEDLLMVWKENYESIETFCRDILQNDSMAEQVANSRLAHFATVTDLTDMIGAMSCT